MHRIAQKGLVVLQIVYFLFSMPVVYRPRPLFQRNSIIRLHMLKLSVGKGRQVMKQLWLRALQYYATVDTERAGYVLYRALVLRCIASIVSYFMIQLFKSTR